jgi:hypothetical protein
MAVVRYTVLRVLLAAAVAGVLWLVGVRSGWVLVLLGILGAGMLSPFLLRRQRDAVAGTLDARSQEARRRLEAEDEPLP